MRNPGYAALWCKSNYSFLEGASHPEELIDRAIELGVEAIAVTDRDGVYGVVRAYSHARDKNIHLIYGAELTLEDQSTLILLAQTREGYRKLCQLITLGQARCPKGESQVTLAEVCAHATDLIALWGGEQSTLMRPIPEHDFDVIAKALKRAFGDRLYAMVVRHHHENQVADEARLLERAARFELPICAAIETLYHRQRRRRLQDILTCIRYNTTLERAGTLLKPNHQHALISPEDFAQRFADLPEAIANTRRIARRCTFCASQIKYAYPTGGLPEGVTSDAQLRRLSEEGAQRRYQGKIPQDVRAQLERELGIIKKLGYAGYFLSMAEIIEFCRDNEILCQGRGSAANSVVCYCLGITAIDPVRMNLLFERFMSEERAEPPDIDLDISHKRREEVIQHVYELYGREHAAILANVVRFRARSAVRSVGEVLGLDAGALEQLAKTTGRSHGPGPEDLAAAGLDPQNMEVQWLLELVEEMLDFPRHLSIHPGGFLLGAEPVHEMVPIEPATMEARTVVQWDKYDVETLGLFKLDLLGLGALTHLDKAFRLMREHRGVELSMAELPVDDPATYAMLQKADSIGVFQVESRAQMAMLPRLRPRVFYDLVIQISLVRPGPISGGMVHPYLRRRSGVEPVEYPHPSLKPVLEKTLGVPLFQEQVMKLAVIAAGYTPGEADQLRRDMGAWRSEGRLEKHREKLISRMIQRGIAREYAQRVFEQIRGFGEYGFPESHAASFALITYATAYLKCHYPVEFTCALLNSQPMGFYSSATIIEDAKRHGVRFEPLDICESVWDCAMEPIVADSSIPRAPRALRDMPGQRGAKFSIRMGFRYLKGMREDAWPAIERARSGIVGNSMRDFERLLQRLAGSLDAQTLRQLAKADAFHRFGISQRDALWRVRGLRRETLPLFPEGTSSAEVAANKTAAIAEPKFAALDKNDAIAWDYRTTFHSLRGHPMQAVRPELKRRNYPDAAELKEYPNGRSTHFVAMVICRQRPSTASGVLFMTLEDETGLANVIVWPKVYEAYRVIARTEAFLGISGQVQQQEGVCHLVAERLWVPQIELRQPASRSRDFR
ncbi:DNA polymerase III subunit alpha [Bradymonas sediminis]|uniref:Error-prone DNA polymerase n=1 Tax=Bradymonas sediminis TaxID=1548548 RepID=A0A2Z4FN84_9DELT|nr:error-prone DNA polymerase [Bradymonas sediminis]AWV90176.1 error-prone DNA polymerase [Bradymonas sediminis]TDP75856.1 DnaE-like error-prone DNA polymerase [Bradymonas sediminis]